MKHKIMAGVSALFAAFTLAAASAPVASADNAGIACNAIRYGYNGGESSQFHAARTYMNPYFGAFNYHWAAYSGGTGFLVNTSNNDANGDGWCFATWWAISNNGNKPPLGCMYYSKTYANGAVRFVRPAAPTDAWRPYESNYPCHN